VPPLTASVLRRVSYGLSPALRAAVAAQGLDGWLEQQLDPASLPDPVGDAVIAANPTLRRTNAQLKDSDAWPLRRDLAHAAIARAVGSTRQVFELMVELWTNHFAIYFEDNWFHTKISDDRDVVRANALGRFEDLLIASARSPAMLVYLDNAFSDANSSEGVNENYGRELLELHTLSLTGGTEPYTEEDVRAVSLVMSGWTIDDSHAFTFDASMHHTGPVQVLGGAWSTPGRSGAAGYEDGVSLLRFLARRPETARNVATKIARRFVADDPPAALVQRLADAYLANDTQITPVLRALFASAEFRTPTSAKVRRPIELVAAMARAYGATLPDGSTSDGAGTIRWMLDYLGQLPFEWPAPNGYPDVAAYWVSADGLLQRWSTGGRIAAGWADNVDTDPFRLLPADYPATWGGVVDAIGLALLDGGFNVAERAALLGYADRAEGDPFDPEFQEWELRGMVGVGFCTPSFQVR
jgi:uncharacterized protein (DUF1800 family)